MATRYAAMLALMLTMVHLCSVSAFMVPQINTNSMTPRTARGYNAQGRHEQQQHVSNKPANKCDLVTASRPLTTRLREQVQEDTEAPVEEYENSRIYYDSRTGRFYEKNVEEVCREEYCAIDETTGKPVMLSKEEKERIFLDSIQTYYYSGKKLLDDDDFDRLKVDLEWEGSDVLFLNRKERLFVSAMDAFLKGKPIISDEEFDTLKSELKEEGSRVAVSTEPKCYIDTGICTVTFQKDNFRTAMVYVAPAGFVFGLFWVGALYELIEPFRYVNPLIIILLAGFPTWASSKVFTENIFLSKNPMVAYGPCPSCGASNRIFFGDVAGVEGFRKEAEFECSNCREQITIRKNDLRARTRPKDMAVATAK